MLPPRRQLQKQDEADGMSMDTVAIVLTVLVGAAGYLWQALHGGPAGGAGGCRPSPEAARPRDNTRARARVQTTRKLPGIYPGSLCVACLSFERSQREFTDARRVGHSRQMVAQIHRTDRWLEYPVPGYEAFANPLFRSLAKQTVDTDWGNHVLTFMLTAEPPALYSLNAGGSV